MLDEGIEESSSPRFACNATHQKRLVDEILRRLQETKQRNQEGQLSASRN